ncbi:MAG: hypothetical protein H6695_18810 [Deferribacteres bacterium]|nr:hypothetical protein [candidate division KSB1 bacterium]MCB9512237.1 hypothetical protein [Deferribacteres bacterium]
MRFSIHHLGRWERAQIEVLPAEKKPAWPAWLDKQAELFWQRAQQSSKKLYNGKLVSLTGAEQVDGKLALYIYETCYRDQMFSNSKIAEWRETGQAHLSARGLGISTMVETSDARVMLIRRSEKVSEHAGFLDVIGGHVHPVDHAPNGIPDVFFAIEDEVRSELGVPVDCIVETICIGLLENSEWLKPELAFVSRLDVASAEVKKFAIEAEERFEYSDLFAIGRSFQQMDDFIKKHAAECTPSADGCLQIYRDHLQNSNT